MINGEKKWRRGGNKRLDCREEKETDDEKFHTKFVEKSDYDVDRRYTTQIHEFIAKEYPTFYTISE